MAAEVESREYVVLPDDDQDLASIVGGLPAAA